jgi:hypothetical protein
VRELNRKVLGIAVVLMAVAVLATPFVGAAQAYTWGKRKTVDVYERTPGVDDPTSIIVPPTPDKVWILCDGSLEIGKGAIVTSTYGNIADDRGPLGYGTGYSEQIWEITRYSGEIVSTPFGPQPEFMSSWGIYKTTIVIDDGPYGTGTLEGYFVAKGEWDLSGPIANWIWDKSFAWSLDHGTGDFAGFEVYAEAYWSFLLGGNNVWHTKTTVIY